MQTGKQNNIKFPFKTTQDIVNLISFLTLFLDCDALNLIAFILELNMVNKSKNEKINIIPNGTAVEYAKSIQKY